MGSKHSKSGVRAEVARILPCKWLELEQLHLRFQHEAHRRARADPQAQFFLSPAVFQVIFAPICAATNTNKAQLLAVFDSLDRRQRRKIAALDFFSGLALMVEGKKSTKFEFILSLLDNGGAKTLNKCELMMVLLAAGRGLAMFKRSPDVREETMRPLAKRLLGDAAEVLRQHAVDKAMADAEIVFVMNDLGAETATTADGLLTQQAKLLQTLALIDYQHALKTVALDTCRMRTDKHPSAVSAAPSVRPPPPQTTLTPPSATRAKPRASVDVLVRKLQIAVCPPPLSSSPAITQSSDSPSTPASTMRPADVKKRVDARCVQRLVQRISDGKLDISANEAAALVAQMASNPLGLVKCGEVLRVLKRWLRDTQQDALTFWETLAAAGVNVLQTVKQALDAMLRTFDASKQTMRILPDEFKAATQLLERSLDDPYHNNNSNNSHPRGEQHDQELHYDVNVAIGAESRSNLETTEAPEANTNVKFRLGISPVMPAAAAAADPVLAASRDLESDDNDASSDVVFVLEFGLQHDTSDDDAIDLASAVEQWLTDDTVWCHFAPIWRACQVTVGSAMRSLEGTSSSSLLLPLQTKVLRIRLTFVDDWFERLEHETGVNVSTLVQSIVVSGECNKPLQTYVDEWTRFAATIHSLTKRESRERVLQLVFTLFDVDRNGVLDLHEFNRFQQALHKSAIDDTAFRTIFANAQSLPFAQFVAYYKQCAAADIAAIAARIGLGSINAAVCGSISLRAVLFEPALRAIEHLLSPLRASNVGAKTLVFACRATNDFACDLRLPDLLTLLEIMGLQQTRIASWLTDTSLPTRALAFVRALLHPVHDAHDRGDPSCSSLFCSLADDMRKTPQQLEFDDYSRGIAVGSSAKCVDALRKCSAALTHVVARVEALERMEVRSASLRILCEFENMRVTLVE